MSAEPAKPLGITELVSSIGDENITVQNLASNMTAGNNGKKQSTITFATSPQMCDQLMREAAGLESATHMAIVLWFPKDKLPTP